MKINYSFQSKDLIFNIFNGYSLNKTNTTWINIPILFIISENNSKKKTEANRIFNHFVFTDNPIYFLKFSHNSKY